MKEAEAQAQELVGEVAAAEATSVQALAASVPLAEAAAREAVVVRNDELLKKGMTFFSSLAMGEGGGAGADELVSCLLKLSEDGSCSWVAESDRQYVKQTARNALAEISALDVGHDLGPLLETEGSKAFLNDRVLEALTTVSGALSTVSNAAMGALEDFPVVVSCRYYQMIRDALDDEQYAKFSTVFGYINKSRACKEGTTLLMPVNEGHSHWVVVVIKFGKDCGKLALLDPLHKDKHKDKPCNSDLMSKLKVYFQSKTKHMSWSVASAIELVGWYPSQPNGTDCAIFCALYVATLSFLRSFSKESWHYNSVQWRNTIHDFLTRCRTQWNSSAVQQWKQVLLGYNTVAGKEDEDSSSDDCFIVGTLAAPRRGASAGGEIDLSRTDETQGGGVETRGTSAAGGSNKAQRDGEDPRGTSAGGEEILDLSRTDKAQGDGEEHPRSGQSITPKSPDDQTRPKNKKSVVRRSGRAAQWRSRLTGRRRETARSSRVQV